MAPLQFCGMGNALGSTKQMDVVSQYILQVSNIQTSAILVQTQIALPWQWIIVPFSDLSRVLKPGSVIYHMSHHIQCDEQSHRTNYSN